MPNFELTLPNINVDVEVASGSFVVIRQPTQTLNRSSIPIQNVAESAITASYALTSSVTLSTVSASYALTASYVSGATATWNTVTNKPSGLVSGAAQITSLGFISQSTTPTGTVSSSAQITAFGFISQSVNTGSFATTGSNTFYGNQFISGGGSLYMEGDAPIWGSRFVGDGRGYVEVSVQSGSHQGIVGVGTMDGNTFMLYNDGVNENELLVYGDKTISLQRIEAPSFTGSILATNGVISSSQQITDLGFGAGGGNIDSSSFATTGSNTFVGYQIVSGAIYMGTGSIVLPNGTEIYDIGNPGVTSGIGLGNNGFSIDFGSNVNDWAIFQNANIIQMAPTNTFTIFITSAGEYSWNFNGSGLQFPDGEIQTTAFTGIPQGTISASAQISQSGFVSSSTINTIQTITSASYAAITPVSGTLYVIID